VPSLADSTNVVATEINSANAPVAATTGELVGTGLGAKTGASVGFNDGTGVGCGVVVDGI